MINPFKEVDWNPGPKQRRSFAISLIIGFPTIALLLLVGGYLRTGLWDATWPLRIGGAGAAAGLLFLALPSIVWPFYVLWFLVACCIGIVVGNVVMAIVFYVFVAGLGLAMRAGGRQALQKTVDRSRPTYWRDAGPRPEPKRYYRQF